MKRILSLFRRITRYSEPQDISGIIKEGIREARTEQHLRNLELIIEAHILDETKRKQLHALLTAYAAIRGIRPVKSTLS